MELKNKFNLSNMIILDKDSINFDEGKYFTSQYFLKNRPQNNGFKGYNDAFHKSIIDSSCELRRRLHLMTKYDFEFVINCLKSKYFYLVNEPIKSGTIYDSIQWEEILKFYYLTLVDTRIRFSYILQDINNKNYEGIQEIQKIYPEFLRNYSIKMKEDYPNYKKMYGVITSLIDELIRQDKMLKSRSVDRYKGDYTTISKEKKRKALNLLESDFFIETNIKKLEYNNSEFGRYLDLASDVVNKQETEEDEQQIKAVISIVNKVIEVNKHKIKVYNKKR